MIEEYDSIYDYLQEILKDIEKTSCGGMLITQRDAKTLWNKNRWHFRIMKPNLSPIEKFLITSGKLKRKKY